MADKELTGDLVGVLFLSRDIAHREHLTTSSYAAHMALADFYTSIISLADELAEAYQGYENEMIDEIPYFDHPGKGDIKKVLQHLFEQVKTMRKEVCPESTMVQNIIDEIEQLFSTTLYKLNRFK